VVRGGWSAIIENSGWWVGGWVCGWGWVGCTVCGVCGAVGNGEEGLVIRGGIEAVDGREVDPKHLGVEADSNLKQITRSHHLIMQEARTHTEHSKPKPGTWEGVLEAAAHLDQGIGHHWCEFPLRVKTGACEDIQTSRRTSSLSAEF